MSFKITVWFSLSVVFFPFCQHLSAQSSERLRYGFEFKGHYRDSDRTKFPIPFPFPPEFLPIGETRGSLETVDAGGHAEVSRISLFLEGELTPRLHGRVRLDTIDKYDRNPTSGDSKVDVDEAFLRLGTEYLPEELGEGVGVYFKLGKFGKFERQDDRNLESYGVLSTAYNRMEDAGLEIGIDFGKHFYLKSSFTVGNPVFFRDPNALAGDNGTAERDPFVNPNPDPELKSGFVMFYDAEVEDLNFSEPEAGLALGFRAGDVYGSRVVNLMVFNYDRQLRNEVNLTGTFYGGDLDLLLGVEELGLVGGLPLQGRDKQERGANLWVYYFDLTFFGQYVDAEVAGLKTTGWEAEAAWSYELPLTWAIAGKPLFSLITPAFRFSRLDPKFTGNGSIYPTPSVWWAWEKVDFGVNLLMYEGLLLTLEYNSVKFLRLGNWEHNDEFLASLSWKWLSP